MSDIHDDYEDIEFDIYDFNNVVTGDNIIHDDCAPIVDAEMTRLLEEYEDYRNEILEKENEHERTIERRFAEWRFERGGI